MIPVLVALLAAALLTAPAGARGESCVVLEDFARSVERAFPEGWEVRDAAGRDVYAVHSERGVRFLRARAQNVGIQAGRAREWDLREYPILRWKWRPRAFPQGADERSDRNDSAVAVYVVFPHSPVSVKTLKYLWSEKVPAGAQLESSHGLTQALVVESGVPRDRTRWVEERVNVAVDYRRRFAAGELAEPAGIAVLTDADDTGSYAEGDYADFRACRE